MRGRGAMKGRVAMNRRAARNSIVILTALTCWACEPSSSRAEKSKTWEVAGQASASGPRFEDQDFVLEVRAAEPCEQDGVLGPTAGQRRLSVPVRIEARGERSIPVSAMEFSIEDADGHRFRPTLAGCREVFRPRDLAKGETLEGYVSFDVPEDRKTFEVVFDPFLIGRKPVVARVRLPY